MGELSTTSKHNHQLLVGSPCLHYCSTKPSWPQTNPPSNLRSQHCNRKAWKKSHTHRPGWDSPCRGLCSTTLSSALTNLLANLRNHRRSCTDRPVARRAEEPASRRAEERWDNLCRGLCSTTPSLALTNLLANLRNHRRSCTDRPARRAAELAPRWAADRLEGSRGGGLGSTTLFYRRARCSR